MRLQNWETTTGDVGTKIDSKVIVVYTEQSIKEDINHNTQVAVKVAQSQAQHCSDLRFLGHTMSMHVCVLRLVRASVHFLLYVTTVGQSWTGRFWLNAGCRMRIL